MKKKFNIGDKVRVIKNTLYDATRVKIGDIGTIKNIAFGSYVIDFNGLTQWTDCSYADEFIEKYNNVADRIIFRDNATILIKDGKRFVAKCCDGDTYDKEKGLLVCLAKAHGYTFNDLQEMLKGAEMQGNAAPQSKVREVKRRAEVGEYVKVVGNVTHHHFSNGEIVKCVRLDGDRVDKFSYIDERDFYYMRAEEYVVLENYNPNTYPYNVPKETIEEALRIVGKNGIGFDTEDEVKEFYELIKNKFPITNFNNDFSRYARFFSGYSKNCNWADSFIKNYTYKQLKAKILELLGE